jgi:hypothetical protein
MQGKKRAYLKAYCSSQYVDGSVYIVILVTFIEVGIILIPVNTVCQLLRRMIFATENSSFHEY